MLILTRRIGESLVISDLPIKPKDDEIITVSVLGVKGNQVRIGVDASREIAVDREEIHERKKAGIPRPNKKIIALNPLENFGNR